MSFGNFKSWLDEDEEKKEQSTINTPSQPNQQKTNTGTGANITVIYE